MAKNNAGRARAGTFRRETTQPGPEAATPEFREGMIEREEAEKALEEHAFTSAVLDTVGALVVVIDREGRIVRFNRACERATGYHLDEVSGRKLWDFLIVPEEAEAVKEVFSQLAAGHFPSQHENYWRAKNGERRLIAWSNTALVSGSSVTHVIGTGIDITLQRRAEEALQKSEERFRALVENTSDIISVVDRAGVIQYASPGVERVLGYKPEELKGAHFGMLVPPGDGERDEERMALFQGPGTQAREERKVRHKDGGWRIVEVTANNQLENPAVNGIIVTAIDVTAQRRAGRLLRTVLDHLPEYVFVKDRERRFVTVNQRAAEDLGLTSVEEVTGKTDCDFLPREVAARYERQDRAVIESGETIQDEEECIIDSSGNPCWRLVTKVPLRNSAGEIEGLAGISRDITQRKRMEEMLRESEERSRIAAECGDDLVYEWDLETNEVKWWGSRDAGIVDLPRSLRDFEKSLHPDDRERVMASIRKLLEKEGHFDEEYRVRANDESYRYWWDRGVVVPYAAGKSGKWIGACIDVTERKSTEEELRRQREKLRSLTARLISAEEEESRRIARDLHDDLGQKISLLGIRIGLLRNKEPKSGSALREDLADLQEQTVALLEDIRSLSYGLHPGVLETAGFVAALESHCREVQQHAGIPVRLSVRQAPEGIPGNVSTTLYRIAQEALRNAVIHSGAAAIRVSVSGAEGGLKLVIADDGRGFETAEHQHGLGLVNIQERARLIGGHFTIESVPNHGTRLEVQVPLLNAKEQAQAQGSSG